MLFAVGTRVKFLHSPDQGVVTALLDDNMVNVLLDGDDLEIPAFIEDLVRAEDYIDHHPSVKAKIIPGKQEKTPPTPQRPAIETQYAILKSRGIQLAFDPIWKADGSTERYVIYLLNDTPYDVLFLCSLQLRDQTGRRQNGKLPALSFIQVGELLFDQLNDNPVVELECWRITTEGTGSRLHRQLRIRPKQFFSRLSTAPLLNRKVHLFKIFENLKESGLDPSRPEDLRTYTQRNARPAKSWDHHLQQRFPHDIQEMAEFVPEIDLHIEKLLEKPAKLSNAEILNIQLRHFDAYMAKAIRLGVDRVFIIHGIGTGRLRDAIATRLLTMPEVTTFKNEYHPRYGWGATEVVLKEEG